MTLNQPFPPQVKGNPLLEWFWRRVHFRDSNVIVLVTGLPGCGKSLTAIELCWMLDRDTRNRPRFTTNDIVFTSEEFAKRIDDRAHQRGACIVWEEPYSSEGGANSRRSMTDINAKISTLFGTMRHSNHIIFLTMPVANTFDKQARNVSHASLVVLGNNGRNSLSRFFVHDLNGLSGKVYQKHMVFMKNGIKHRLTRVITSSPPPTLTEAYKRKANARKAGWRKHIAATIGIVYEKYNQRDERRKAVQALENESESFKRKDGKPNLRAIAKRFDVSYATARNYAQESGKFDNSDKPKDSAR